eukprot:GFUD01084321.1.p1 GENE.GFUD01084321.1~~GFUD01084321.1.p1  ORF type:complete len:191 (+),score=11.20 GFUD01084321.1:67-573(+)
MDSKLLFPAALLLLVCLIDTGLSDVEEGSGHVNADYDSFIGISRTADSQRIRCHQCNSYEHAHCDDPFHHTDDPTKEPKTDEFLKDCPNDGVEYFCRKIYQNVRGVERVIRSCGYIKDDKDRQCYTTVLEEYNTLVCQCGTDGCNSASMGKVSIVAIVSALLLACLIH